MHAIRAAMSRSAKNRRADVRQQTTATKSRAATATAESSSPALPPRVLSVALVLAACAVPLAYAVYTNHIWEDSFITLRHGENLLKGEGLVFNPGERIHGFTSPINVLVLALCSAATGQVSYVVTFWLYRVLCIAAFATGIALVSRRLWVETPAHPLICAGTFGLLSVFDLKMVAFTANGMETAFVLLFLAGAFARLVMDDPRPWLARGLFWGGLMWSRPDGCVYIAAMALADLWFSPSVRGKLLASFVKSGLVCTAVYGPWFAFAWWYYGSPVPHTVIAKGPVETGMTGQLQAALENPRELLEAFLGCANAAFQPIYRWFPIEWFDQRLVSWALAIVTRSASIFCLVYWLFPVNDRLGRAASLCFFVVMLYFALIMVAPWPWYLPPATLLGLVTLARGIVTLSDVALRGAHKQRAVGRAHPLALTALAILVVGQIALCGWNAIEMRIQQTEIEMGNRMALGTWLREHGRPEESVYLEPLGYIGYFSGMRMVDWPGLVAPQVVAARRASNPGQLGMIFEIQPDWVVLRQSEYDRLGPLRDQFDRQYALETSYDATERLKRHRAATTYFDAVFRVFRRRDLRPEDFKSQPAA